MKVNMQKTLRFSAANKLNYWAMLLLIVLQVFVSIGRVTALPTVVDTSRSHPNPSEADEDDSQHQSPFHFVDNPNSSSSSSFHYLDSSSSSLHKIIHHHHQPYAQPTRTAGAFHLHKLIQKLSFHKESLNKNNKKPIPPNLPRKNTNKNVIASTINVKSLNGSLLIRNDNNDTASRLKRQLEGIFHVRETPSSSTAIPILPLPDQSNFSNKTSSRKSLFTRPDNRRLRVNGFLTNVNNKSHQRINSTKTTKVETRKKFPNKESFDTDSMNVRTEATPHSLVTHNKWKPPPLLGSLTTATSTNNTTSPFKKNGNNNVTVEIIETSRRTVIKHDGINNNDHDDGESPVENPFGDSRSTPNDQKAVIFPSPSPIQEESSLLKSTPIFRSIRPRLKHQKRFRQGGGAGQGNNKNYNESPPPSSSSSSPEDSTTIEDTHEPIPTTRPRNNHNSNNPKSPKSLNLPKREIIIEDLTQPGDVKVSSFQEQIPYNDREVSEADLKDYLEGHTTFGAKGNFKHIVSRNITGFIPHHHHHQSSGTEVKRNHHGVYKRTPAAGQSSLDSGGGTHTHRKRNSRGGNHDRNNNNNEDAVSISQAEVKKFNRGREQNPKMTIYTASGVKYAPSSVDDQEDLGKQFYEYSGGKSKNNDNTKDKNYRRKQDEEARRRSNDNNHDDRDGSSREDNNSNQFDELYKQGHPGIAKPPQIIYKSHPLGVPYGRVEDLDLYNESPLRADPLSDDVPLKFDPASDVFYGNPKPDKDKNIAQSNRPAPVRVENEDRESSLTTSTMTSKNRHPYRDHDEISKRVGESDNNNGGGGPDENGRYYPPPSYSEDERGGGGGGGSSRRPPSYEPSSGDNNDDQYFKDFVSLDNNFQQLPRPSKEDESFSSLIPPEANDYEDDGRYYADEDDDGYNSRRGGGEGRGSSSTSGYDKDDRETTDRNRDRDRYNKDSERDDAEEPDSRHSNNNDHDDRTERSRDDDNDDQRRGSSSSRRPPSRGGSGGQAYGGRDDGYDDFGLNQEGVSPEYFDSSYVDALKHFDDEIKKLEEHERQVGSTENPTNSPGATTREPPLVISSPGPAVSYERSNHPRPSSSVSTDEPTHYNNDPREEEDEGTHHHRQGDDHNRNKPPEKEERGSGDDGRDQEERAEEDEEGEEVEVETPAAGDEPSSTKKNEESDGGGGEEDSEEDESQPEKRGVKVVETEEVKRVRQEESPTNSTTNASAKDTAGNIDDDISGIEKEYGGK